MLGPSRSRSAVGPLALLDSEGVGVRSANRRNHLGPLYLRMGLTAVSHHQSKYQPLITSLQMEGSRETMGLARGVQSSGDSFCLSIVAFWGTMWLIRPRETRDGGCSRMGSVLHAVSAVCGCSVGIVEMPGGGCCCRLLGVWAAGQGRQDAEIPIRGSKPFPAVLASRRLPLRFSRRPVGVVLRHGA